MSAGYSKRKSELACFFEQYRALKQKSSAPLHWGPSKVIIHLVAQPTRWSPIVIWVFVGQSSSWPWEPHIRGFKLLKPVLRTQMAVFDPVFCKMYLLYRSCPRRKSFSSNFCLFPSQNDCFLQPLEGTWQLSWFGVHSGGTPNWDYWKSWFGVLSQSL